MIEVNGLTKRYGSKSAIEGVTFEALPGEVTGLLGPNGAGKSTTMAITLGLKAPTHGTAMVGRQRHEDLVSPLRNVGAVLEGAKAHPRHRVRSHLRWIAASHAIPKRRVDEVIDATDIERLASRRTGALSTGERQRLGIATALLGDPEILILDEPGNGLDVEGLRWLRSLIRSMAAEGRTVLVSSHVLSWMNAVADRLVVLARGRLIADITLSEVGRADLEEWYIDLLGRERSR